MPKPPKRCPPRTRPSGNPPRCIPIIRQMGGSWGAPGGGMFPFSSSAGPFIGPTPTPPAPVITACRDMLTSVPFSVPFTTTIHVSGGGAALQAAVTAAAPGTRIRIQDSLSYDGNLDFNGKLNLTVEAAPGKTPKITAPPGVNQHAVFIQIGTSGIHLKGLTLIGNGNLNVLSQDANGILLGSPATGMGAFDRLIVEDCEFQELDPTLGVPGIQLIGGDGTLNDNVQLLRCRFTDCCTPAFSTVSGYGAVTIGGFDRVYIQNCEILRQAVARAASHMRGVVVKNLNTIVEDVLCRDIGTAGSNEAFKHASEALLGTAVGSTSSRNCVAYNCHRAFRIALGGATMTITKSVSDNDIPGIAAGQTLIQETAGTLTITDSVLTGAGDGTTFTAGVSENHNDVFNYAATGKVLDVTDITVDPLYEDVPNGDFVATAPECQMAASDGGAVGIRYPGGQKIIWCNH